MSTAALRIKPQKGFQEKVFDCTADIAIIGGSAGGGKSCALIIEPMKWIGKNVEGFSGAFFRRTRERIRATGGLLSESKKWYIEGDLSESTLKWRFPSGAEIDFEGIEYLKDLEKWLGAQIPFIGFDELIEFEEEMFWFMISRNRGIVKVKQDGKTFIMKPYVRASTNPKPNCWVYHLIEWWIDQVTGFPIPEKDGVLRYFIRFKDKMYWGDTVQEVLDSCPEVVERMRGIDDSIKPEFLVKSITFIRGMLSENKILTKNSPEYYASLLSQSEENQKKFLEGNWFATSNGMELFEDTSLRKLFSRIEISPILSGAYLNHYITCDAAKFGQDLCVVYGWDDWKVVWVTVFYKSSPRDVFNEVEGLMNHLQVPRRNVMIDQDGLGGDIVKLGRYQGFLARKTAVKVKEMKDAPENYKMFKDQCFFHAAEKVNTGECKFFLTTSNVKIYDDGSKHPRFGLKLKVKGEMVNIKDEIYRHLSSVKKGETTMDGGESKYSINTKEEQKEILNGASPDFADPVCMRAAFDLEKRRSGISRLH